MDLALIVVVRYPELNRTRLKIKQFFDTLVCVEKKTHAPVSV